MPLTKPLPRYRSIPSAVVGGTAFRVVALGVLLLTVPYKIRVRKAIIASTDAVKTPAPLSRLEITLFLKFMAIRRKTIIVATVIAAAAVGAAALLLTVLAYPDRYRPQVISYLEAKTGKQIEVGHIGVNWVPLSIRLDNFGCKSPKPFPSGYFLKAARMDAAIDVAALLHRQIVIKSIVLHEPIINVISDPDGLWNFENPVSKTSQERPPIFAFGVLPRVEIIGGQLSASSLIDPSDRPGPVVFEAHNVTATL